LKPSTKSRQSQTWPVVVAQETPNRFWRDAAPLLYRHWQALCVDPQRLRMDLDLERYGKLWEAGALYVLGARCNGKLLGYLIAFVLPHFHYKSAGNMGMTDMYWVDPQARRGVGLKLFARFERDMRKRGVVQLVTSCKVHDDHTLFFESLDWRHTDNTFCKFL
jgi:hypothetical protein